MSPGRHHVHPPDDTKCIRETLVRHGPVLRRSIDASARNLVLFPCPRANRSVALASLQVDWSPSA